MITWIKTDKVVNEEGTTITYRGNIGRAALYNPTGYTIESRKRHIPHSNRPGTWDHTTYFVLKDGKEVVEKYSLKDAKIYAEKAYAAEEGEHETD